VRSYYYWLDIGPSTARDCAELSIKSMIFSGELGPGEKLPPERILSQQLGVSRVPLREALKSLESTGFIRTTVGAKGGSRVSDARILVGCWHEWLRANAHKLSDLLEFRRTIDMQIASLAAERRTEEDLRELRTLTDSMDDSPTWINLSHTQFHRALCQAAHNEYFERATNAIQAELFAPVQTDLEDLSVPTLRTLHEDILTAVEAQDPARAAEAMQVHLEFTEKMFFHRMDELGLNTNGSGRNT
jgi:GntR family transcriptional repressor for pyruvate dehydrogenase complex